MIPAALTPERRRAAEQLAADLRRIFGVRLHSVVAYGLDPASEDGQPLHTLALVERITFDDLAACISPAHNWQRMGLAVPLLLSRAELRRTLDVFAVEYGAIVASHVVVEGDDPFADVRVAEADVRRACERQAKSHLIHLREGFLESGNQPRAIARLAAESAPAFRALLVNLGRLDGRFEAGMGDEDIAEYAQHIGISPAVVRDVLASSRTGTIVDPSALLARYIEAAERIWQYVDGWSGR